MTKVSKDWITSENASLGTVLTSDGECGANWSDISLGETDSAYVSHPDKESLTNSSWIDIPGTTLQITTKILGHIAAWGLTVVTSSGGAGGTEAEFRLVIDAQNSDPVVSEPYDDLERPLPVFFRTNTKLVAGSYTVKMQWRRIYGTSIVYGEDSQILAISLTSPKGDKGDTGSGSSIDIEDEGSPVTGTPHSILNFKGNGVTVTNAGSGVADVEIDSGSGAANVASGSSEGTSGTTSTDFQLKLRVTTPSLIDGVRYRIDWQVELGVTYDSEVTIEVYLGAIKIAGSGFYNYPYDTTRYQQSSGFYISNTLSGIKNIDLTFSKMYGGTAYARCARIIISTIP